MQEIWKDIESYEGLYQISNLGNVKSVERIVKRGTNFKPVRERVLSVGDKDGYKHVILSKNGKPKTGWVHRLVAEAFLSNPDKLPVVNHKDENPSNNCVENLEWCTNYENAHHAIENGLWENVFKASTKTNEARKIKCKAVSKTTGNEIYFQSISEAERYFNNRHICDVLKGKRHSVQGYTMQYVYGGE